MSTTKSPLRTVIKVKSHLEKKAHRELVEIQGRLQQESQQLGHLNEVQEAVLDETLSGMKARATELQTSRAFLQNLAHQIYRQQKKVAEIEKQEERKRSELLEKAQSKQMVKKLEEKRVAQEIKEKERKEQRMIDILAHRVRFGF